MATETKLILETVVKWTAEASKALKSIKKSINGITEEVWKSTKSLKKFADNNKVTFQKMTAVWAVAFWVISLWIRKTTQDAAEAEWTWNKFNTVFWETSNEMSDFITDIRKRMPVATDDIARMAADLQDLLVPLGLSRELWADMTKGFLEVANAVGAFNDVNPKEVLDAIKSWLTGISMPLKRFWIDASVWALEAIAMEEGLLKAWESFAKLQPKIRNQIRAQALLTQVQTQSSDAINGFAENSDSLIFRQLELQATMSDLSWIIWKAFLPIIDDVLKTILPIVKNISTWAEKNPELIKQITILAIWFAWIVTALWVLWLAIPLIIKGFLWLTVAVKALWIALRFLALNPIWLVITAIATWIFIWIQIVKNWDKIKEKAIELWKFILELYENNKILFSIFAPLIAIWIEIFKNWDKIKEGAISLWNKIQEIAGIISTAWNNLWINLELVWWEIKQWFLDLVDSAKEWWRNIIQMLINWIREKATALKDSIIWIATTIKDYLWFGSPTKKWPNSNSDKWIPNLIKMLQDWFKKGQWWMDSVVSNFADSIWISLTEWLKNKLEKIKESFSDLSVSAISAFDKIKTAISGQKTKISGLADEWKALNKELKAIDVSIKGIQKTWAWDIATRAVEIQNELQWEITWEKRLQLQKELELAKTQVSSNDIANARIELEKSQTQKIIDRINIRVAEAETEKKRIQELMALKRAEIEDEMKKHKEMIDEKKKLDQVYFDFFGKRIEKETRSVDSLIRKMQQLIRLSWWTIRAEVFTDKQDVISNEWIITWWHTTESRIIKSKSAINPNQWGTTIVNNISWIFWTDAVDEIWDQNFKKG